MLNYLLVLGLLGFWRPATVMAQTADTSDKNLTVVALKDAPAFAKRALVIGIDGYRHVPKLTVCAHDAHKFAALLKSKFGFTDVVQMTDEPDTPEDYKPTYSNIRFQLRALKDGVVASQTEVVLFYSGHGVRAPNGESGDVDWLVPVDGDAEDIPGTCIDYTRFKNDLETKRPARALLVMDACRNLTSGKGVGGSGFGGAQALLGPQIAELLSCQPTQVSREGAPADFSESVFTHYLIAGLEGDKDALSPGTNTVTFDSLKLYVQGAVSGYVRDRFQGAVQVPDGQAKLGSMVLAKVDKNAGTGSAGESHEAEAKTQFDLAIGLFNQKKYSEAEPFLREAVRLEPTNALYQHSEAVNLEWLNRWADAEPFSLEAARLASANPYYQADAGDVLFNQEKYADAEPFYRETVRLDPTNAVYQCKAGNTLNAQKKYAEAEPYIREAVRLKPSDALYQENLGVDLFNQQKYVEAEQYYRESLRLQPESAECQNGLGNTLFAQRKYTEAGSCYREAIRLDPANAIYQVNTGNDLFQQQKYTEALPFYREAVRLDPNNTDCKTDLDNCLKHTH